jgi:acyl-coenzyme A thioesterase PaaI-like protein
VQARQRAASRWPGMVEQLRHLQDEVAGSAPPDDVVHAVTALIVQARSLLAGYQVGDGDQLFGRLLDMPERGQSLSPPLHVLEYDEDRITLQTMFGRFHSGIGAVHGGAVALLFDDVLGRLADLGDGPPSRTAWLRVDYRSLTPVNEPLTVRAAVVERTGRKRFLEATLCHGDRICAQAQGLFVAVRPDQMRPLAG